MGETGVGSKKIQLFGLNTSKKALHLKEISVLFRIILANWPS